jgi:TPR repeat protein
MARKGKREPRRDVVERVRRQATLFGESLRSEWLDMMKRHRWQRIVRIFSLFLHGYQNLDVSNDDIRAMFAKFDWDQNTYLDRNEVSTALDSIVTQAFDNQFRVLLELAEHYAVHDTVSSEEFQRLLRKDYEKLFIQEIRKDFQARLDAFIADLDVNKDKRVSPQEFVKRYRIALNRFLGIEQPGSFDPNDCPSDPLKRFLYYQRCGAEHPAAKYYLALCYAGEIGQAYALKASAKPDESEWEPIAPKEATRLAYKYLAEAVPLPDDDASSSAMRERQQKPFFPALHRLVTMYEENRVPPAIIDEAMAYEMASETVPDLGSEEARRAAWCLQRACRYLEYGSDAGDSRSSYRLAVHHIRGWGVEKNLDLALFYLDRAAEQTRRVRKREDMVEAGERNALYEAGIDLLLRADVDRADKRRARDLMEKAANLGHPDALYVAGLMHFMGFETPRDVERAKDYWNEAAKVGKHKLAAEALQKRLAMEKEETQPEQLLPQEDQAPSREQCRACESGNCAIL